MIGCARIETADVDAERHGVGAASRGLGSCHESIAGRQAILEAEHGRRSVWIHGPGKRRCIVRSFTGGAGGDDRRAGG